MCIECLHKDPLWKIGSLRRGLSTEPRHEKLGFAGSGY